ncbi:hypothetical protein [Agromyces aerolatus]|uniref:hypothetical protein n=1 Tax=Agromyces sp. LY-1074 TaxID=3074080 RepID=UPI002861EF5D|nr:MULTISPECIES: hypothetical protein [unclassified Agromyces]MDR5700821.1 hypothetical protein [Agromyces sp. LY-1074]MDR5707342.1 hypothetical protein [Agromyces sp. LY-1358]
MSEDPAELAARVRELEIENARLSAEQMRVRPNGGSWRTGLSAVSLILAAVLVPVSIAGAWARVQLVQEESFVSTLGPLIDDPALQELIVDEAMTAIRAQIDFAELTEVVFEGVAELGLPSSATAALDLLRQPAAAGLEHVVQATISSVVESEPFSDAWSTTLRSAHRALALAASSDGGGIIVLNADGVGIAVGPLLEDVKTLLSERGVAVAMLIPAVDRTIIVGSAESLIALRAGYAAADAIGWWLPVITLALFATGILLSRRRNVAVYGTGIGLFVGAASLGAALSIGSLAAATVALELDLSPAAIDVVYAALIDDMRQTSWISVLIGVLIVIAAWVTGRSEAARRLRTGADAITARGRRSLAARGFDTGKVGGWLGRYRRALRIALAVVAVLWLFALRPIGVGDIAVVLLLVFVAGFALELLQRRPEERVEATPTDLPMRSAGSGAR